MWHSMKNAVTDRAISLAMAYAECSISETIAFDRGEADINTEAAGASRRARSTISQGRVGVQHKFAV